MRDNKHKWHYADCEDDTWPGLGYCDCAEKRLDAAIADLDKLMDAGSFLFRHPEDAWGAIHYQRVVERVSRDWKLPDRSQWTVIPAPENPPHGQLVVSRRVYLERAPPVA